MMTAVPEAPERAWIVGLPKAEVHLHLEGCIPTPVGDDGSEGPPAPAITSLAELLSHLDRSCGRIERAEQLGEIAHAGSAGGPVPAGARHIDVIVNPSHWPHWRDRLGAMVDALDGPLRRGRAGRGCRPSACASASAAPPAPARPTSWWTLVLALGAPPGRRASRSTATRRVAPTTSASHGAFARASRAGLRRCAHAGESSGPEGVREAVELLGAERIDHGIRCVEDPALVDGAGQARSAARHLPDLQRGPRHRRRPGRTPHRGAAAGRGPGLDQHRRPAALRDRPGGRVRAVRRDLRLGTRRARPRSPAPRSRAASPTPTAGPGCSDELDRYLAP